jgi:hypothetical protein
MELLLWLVVTRLAGWVGGANTILAYPTVLFLHTIGLVTVAGFSALLSLRVLGFAPKLPFTALTPFIPAIWVAFAVTAASGTALLLPTASSKVPSAIFLIKLAFVGLGVVTVHLMTKQVFRNPLADRSPLPGRATLLAAASLFCWVAATTAGRLMAYIV